MAASSSRCPQVARACRLPTPDEADLSHSVRIMFQPFPCGVVHLPSVNTEHFVGRNFKSMCTFHSSPNLYTLIDITTDSWFLFSLLGYNPLV